MGILLFISGSEIFVILIVVLLLFGAKKIPEIARVFGKGMSEFRKASDEIKKEFRETSDIAKDIKDFEKDVTKNFNRDDIINDIKEDIKGPKN